MALKEQKAFPMPTRAIVFTAIKRPRQIIIFTFIFSTVSFILPACAFPISYRSEVSWQNSLKMFKIGEYKKKERNISLGGLQKSEKNIKLEGKIFHAPIEYLGNF
jgi:hypothetical protein